MSQSTRLETASALFAKTSACSLCETARALFAKTSQAGLEFLTKRAALVWTQEADERSWIELQRSTSKDFLLIHSSTLRSTLVLAYPLSPHAIKLVGEAGGRCVSGGGLGEQGAEELELVLTVVERELGITAKVDHYRPRRNGDGDTATDQGMYGAKDGDTAFDSSNDGDIYGVSNGDTVNCKDLYRAKDGDTATGQGIHSANDPLDTNEGLVDALEDASSEVGEDLWVLVRNSPEASTLEAGTLHPDTETRNPKPETRNPKPETRNPKPEPLQTIDPEPWTLNPQPSTLDPEAQESASAFQG
jgi:hypothetical protein